MYIVSHHYPIPCRQTIQSGFQEKHKKKYINYPGENTGDSWCPQIWQEFLKALKEKNQ